jgi:Fe-S cluster biosynthesis and repair protein YggX
MNDKVVMTDEKPQMPPYPDGLFEYTEEQEKNLKYNGDLEDINRRVSQKLYNTWILWSNLRNNEKLIDIISKEEGKNIDKESDEFFLKSLIVNHIDYLAKILGNTNIAQEILHLSKK